MGEAAVRECAGEYDWNYNPDYTEDNIVAFRVVKEHREPREFWITVYDDQVKTAFARLVGAFCAVVSVYIIVAVSIAITAGN